MDGSIRDPDGDPVKAIAVTAVDNTHGTWQYKVGAGNWTAFDFTTNSGKALLLDSTDSIRFAPDANWSGTVSNGITFRAWDKSSGTAGDYLTIDGNTGGAGPLSKYFDTAAITVNSVNNAPEITSNGGGDTAAINVDENTTAVTTVIATDADEDQLTFAISGGADADLFAIDANSGALTFKTAPDFENPKDQGDTAGNNTYVVEVQASDDTAADTQTITVTVTDVSEGGGGGSTPPPDPEPEPDPIIPPPEDWDDLDNDDGDEVPDAIEDLVPPLDDGGTTGDGNGDGTPDSDQKDVASVPIRDTDEVSKNPEAPTVFATIVGGTQPSDEGDDGAPKPSGGVTIGVVTQQDAPPAEERDGIAMPLGLIGFEADAEVPEGSENAGDIPFSLLIEQDPDTPEDEQINGFWKQTTGGDWVNLASEDYGGQVSEVGGKIRLDFVIEDNGPFDSNPAPGAISDPGAPGYRAAADPAPGCPYDPFQPDRDADGMPDAIDVALGFDPEVKDNAIFTNDSLFVRQLFRDLLGREGRQAGIDYYTETLANGTLDRQGLIGEFVQSAEFSSHFAAISALYHSLYERSPTNCGMDYWLGEAQQGTDLQTIAGAMLALPEAQSALGAELTNAEFVAGVLANVYGTDVSEVDTSDWVARLDAGESRAALLADWAASETGQNALEAQIMTDALYIGLLDRAAQPAGQAYWEEQYPLYDDAGQFLYYASDNPEYHDRFLPEETAQPSTQSAAFEAEILQATGQPPLASAEEAAWWG